MREAGANAASSGLRPSVVLEATAPPAVGAAITAVVWLAIAAGVALRIWILTGPLGTVDSDEAVGGLMARHVLDGEFPTFYWGQPYGGSQEAFVTALAFAIAGSSILTLKLVPIGFAVAAAWVTWRIGLRTVGEPAARIAAALFWMWPAFGVFRSTKNYTFYSFGMLATLLVVLLVLRLEERLRGDDLLWLGLAAGSGWWATAQVVFVIVPAVLWLVIRRRDVLRKVHVIAAGFLLGAGPWIVYNLTHQWAALNLQFADLPNNGYLDHIAGYFRAALPASLGLRVPASQQWVLIGSAAGWALYLVMLGAFTYLIWRRPRRLEPLIAIWAGYPLLFAISPLSWYVDNPRYLFFLLPMSALLLAWGFVKLRIVMPAIAVCLALTVAALGLMADNESRPPSSDFDPPRRIETLITDLKERGVTRVFANYWTAYKLTFESDEEIIAAPTGHVRYQPHNLLVRRSPTPGYVIVAGSPTDRKFRRALRGLRLKYEYFQSNGYSVYQLSGIVIPELFPRIFDPPEAPPVH